ncbi:hypothetical protein E4U54_006250 [Claviceps lovelessii]|nr:hypothetical protein E4U54_006250 [Claviceps lovelessii]
MPDGSEDENRVVQSAPASGDGIDPGSDDPCLTTLDGNHATIVEVDLESQTGLEELANPTWPKSRDKTSTSDQQGTRSSSAFKFPVH